MYCVLLIFLVLLERGADGSVEVYQVQHSASSNGMVVDATVGLSLEWHSAKDHTLIVTRINIPFKKRV